MGQIFRDEMVIPVTMLSVIDDDVDFETGDVVRITGTSKGRGFQGVIKRHGFHGGPRSHGQKTKHRSPGSIGATGPQRVFPLTKMAGRMGGDTITLKNRKIVAFNKENRLLMIGGAIPGRRGSLVKIYKS